MAKSLQLSSYIKQSNKKRPGVHSKNASKGQNGWKKVYKGQGKRS